LALLVLVSVSANIQNDRLVGRTVTAPNCPIGNLGCSLIATDLVNNNNPRQTNISTVRVDTTGGNIKASFSYQGANVANELILPVSAAASLGFVGVYEWHDGNHDNIPTDDEMSNGESFTAIDRSWQSVAYGSGIVAQNMPFSSGLDYFPPSSGNFSIYCYIVKNFTLDVPPDYVRMTGYGSICRLHVIKSVAMSTGGRIALKFKMDTSLPDGSVGTSSSTYVWSIFTTATANRLRVGETWVQFARQAQPEGALSSTVTAALGPFTATIGSEQSVYVGMLQNDAYNFHYDVAFEPVNLAYNGAASTTLSIFVLLAIVCVAFFQ